MVEKMPGLNFLSLFPALHFGLRSKLSGKKFPPDQMAGHVAGIRSCVFERCSSFSAINHAFVRHDLIQ